MTVQLAPRPKNEERRVIAVKRTGIIDNNQDSNFSIFCDLGRELTGFDYAAFSLFDENFQCKISERMVQQTIRVSVMNLMFALMCY